MNLSNFLNDRGFPSDVIEGYSQQVQPQVNDLIQLTKSSNIKNILEIGFNAGHSAEVFLHNNNHIKLTSFDLGSHAYVHHAKEYIDAAFPNRHDLVLGDSTVTLPEFIKHKTGTTFDVIFVDGGHDYEVAKADLENCFHLSHKHTIVILDDTMYTQGWDQLYTIGPTKTWVEHLQEKKIFELGRRDYSIGRGMSWGFYNK